MTIWILISVLFLLTLVFILEPLVVNNNYKTHIEEYLTGEMGELETVKDQIGFNFREIKDDIKFFSSHTELLFKSGIDNNQLLNHLKLDFLQNVFNEDKYEQISFINSSGFEIVRITTNNGSAYAVTGDELQNDSQNLYFNEILNLCRGEMFISPLYLDKEPEKIEFPLKPLIRIASPVFDSNNSKLGTIILNYLGNNILAQIYEMDNRFDFNDTMLLINKNGNIFKGFNVSEEWGSYMSHNISFKNNYENVWNNLVKEKGFIESDEGFYTYYSFNPFYSDNFQDNNNSIITDVQSNLSYEWVLISYFPQEHLLLIRNSLQEQFLQFSLPFIMIFAIFSLFFSYLLVLKNNSEMINRDQEKKQKDNIERANKLLQNQKEELSGFAHAMKHDLGNYLSALSQYIELFKLEKNEYLLVSMEGQVNKIESLLLHSLKLADLGQVIDKKTSVNINKILSGFTKSYGSVEIIKQEDFPYILGDEQKIQEMILNIVENAFFHGKAKSITFSIHKSASEDKFYNFLIKNNGQPINSDIKNKIFRKGFSTKNSNKSEFGLGLYIVYKICNSHGWSIQLKDNFEVTFEIKIPSSDIILERN